MATSRSASGQIDERTARRYEPAGRATMVLAITGVLVVGQMYTVIPLFDQMGATFAVSPSALTWMASTFGIAYAFGFLVAGPLADRFGPRTVITLGLLTTAVTTAAVAASPGLVAGCVLRAVQGITAATFAPSAFAYVAQHLDPRRRALALTAITSGFLAAAVLMQVAAQVIGAALSWQAVFLVSALCLLLASVATHEALRPTSGEHTASIRSAFAAMPRLLARPDLLALYGATMTVLGGFVAIYTAVTLTGPPSVAGDPSALLVLRASALPAMIIVPVITPLLARLGALTRIAAGLGLAAVAALAASVVGSDIVSLGAVLLVFVAGIAVAAPALVETIGVRGGSARGAAVALYAFAMFVGASLGPQLANLLAATGFGGIARVTAAILAAGALLPLLTARRAATLNHEA